MDLHRGVRPGEQNHSARVTEHDRRAHVAGVEDVLDREDRRLVTANQLENSIVDLGQSPRQIITWLGADHATLDERERIAAIHPNYAVACNRGPGIDPEDDYGLGVTHRTYLIDEFIAIYRFFLVTAITPLNPPCNPKVPPASAAL